MTRYGVIVADPPWSYSNAAAKGSAENHYGVMADSAIANIEISTKDDAVLLLWATWPKLPEAMDIIKAWGFDYVTGLPWVKITGYPSVDLWGDLHVKPQYGVGFWFRGCTEPILVARKGKPDLARIKQFVGVLSNNLGHSRKPENIYQIAEQFDGPYLELFARRARAGWDVWGDQAPNAVAIGAARLA